MDFAVFVWGGVFGWMAADVFLYAAAGASVSLSASLVLAGCHICQLLGATHSFQSPTVRAQLIDYLCYSPAVAYRKSATRAPFTVFTPGRHSVLFDLHLIVIVWMCLNPANCNTAQFTTTCRYVLLISVSTSSCICVLIPSAFQISFPPKMIRNLQKSFGMADMCWRNENKKAAFGNLGCDITCTPHNQRGVHHEVYMRFDNFKPSLEVEWLSQMWLLTLFLSQAPCLPVNRDMRRIMWLTVCWLL